MFHIVTRSFFVRQLAFRVYQPMQRESWLACARPLLLHVSRTAVLSSNSSSDCNFASLFSVFLSPVLCTSFSFGLSAVSYSSNTVSTHGAAAMLATLVLALLALFNFTSALTTPARFRSYKSDCKALIEDTPWQITNLVTFQTNLTSKASNCSSYISFNFRDVNTGLELSTSCNRTVKAGGNETLSNEAYFPCESEDVNFIWEDGVLSVERWYEDPW